MNLMGNFVNDMTPSCSLHAFGQMRLRYSLAND
jgi:hypothetical protein